VADTTYIVLRGSGNLVDGNTDLWDEAGTTEATNADAAIRKIVAARPDPSGTYVAVPQRSWKPVQVTAVQTTTLKLEQPS
jgi:hypothetical protein